MQSGIVEYVIGLRSSTPSISSVVLSIPPIRAPIKFSIRATSATCGSRAAPWIVVRPGVSTAANSTLIVAPTEEPFGPSRFISAPFIAVPSAITYPASSSIFTPSASNPRRCRSIGRGPIAHPPGSETFARFSRASIGPIT